MAEFNGSEHDLLAKLLQSLKSLVVKRGAIKIMPSSARLQIASSEPSSYQPSLIQTLQVSWPNFETIEPPASDKVGRKGHVTWRF
jgi:hypothetical protein